MIRRDIVIVKETCERDKKSEKERITDECNKKLSIMDQ